MLNNNEMLGDLPVDAQPEAVLLQLGELGPVGHHHQRPHSQAGAPAVFND